MSSGFLELIARENFCGALFIFREDKESGTVEGLAH